MNEELDTAPLVFDYTNWEGKTEQRTVVPIKVWYGKTQWHPDEQWFLKATDIEKQAERDFAMRDILKIY